MNGLVKTAIVMLSMAVVTASMAQEQDGNDHETLKGLIHRTAKEINVQNYVLALGDIHPTDFTTFGANPQGQLIPIKKDGLVKLAEAIFPLARVRVSDPQKLKIRVHGDSALATYLQRVTLGEGEDARAMTVRVTDVFFKIEDSWQKVHAHQSHLIAP